MKVLSAQGQGVNLVLSYSTFTHKDSTKNWKGCVTVEVRWDLMRASEVIFIRLFSNGIPLLSVRCQRW